MPKNMLANDNNITEYPIVCPDDISISSPDMDEKVISRNSPIMQPIIEP
jgi:hypothetical protein